MFPQYTLSRSSIHHNPHLALYHLNLSLLFNFLISHQHEKFTSGLQLSRKPSSGEKTTTSSKSPLKTPTKTLKSPSGSSLRPVESRTADGVTSSKEPQIKPVDTQKAEERIGGERNVKRSQILYEDFFVFFVHSSYLMS